MASAIMQYLVDIYNIPKNFNGSSGRKLLDAYPDYPVYATVLYLLAVFYLPGYLQRRKKVYRIKWPVALWNLSFSLISGLGAYFTVQMCYDFVFVDRGFYRSCCELLTFQDGVTNLAPRLKDLAADTVSRSTHLAAEESGSGAVVHTFISMDAETRTKILQGSYVGPRAFFVALFMYLKTPELLDTVFLILQDKPVSFLHWFHHILTAVYCWHAGYTLIPAGIFFSTMNYCVHFIMYFYYFLVTLGYRKSIRPFAPVITLLQVTQMFFGVGITTYTYLQYWLGPTHKDELFYKFFAIIFSSAHYLRYQLGSLLFSSSHSLLPHSQVPTYRMEDHFAGCDTDRTNLRMGVMMYGSYCILFGVLFKELYLDKRANERSIVLARKQKESQAKAEKGVKPAAAKVESSMGSVDPAESGSDNHHAMVDLHPSNSSCGPSVAPAKG